MPSEQVTISISSSRGDDGPLTAQDALCQLLDFFELLTLAGGNKDVVWNLVSVSRNSPMTATAEAMSFEPGAEVDLVGRFAKLELSNAMAAVVEGDIAPLWLDRAAQARLRSMLQRNLNGIGETHCNFHDAGIPIALVERNARVALNTLDRSELELRSAEADLSRVEYGSIEGVLEYVDTYWNQPAIRIIERRSRQSVPCVMSAELASRTAVERAWGDVWKGIRLRVIGRLTYRKDGHVGHVSATDLVQISRPTSEILTKLPHSFLGESNPQAYIDQQWSGDVA